MIHWLRPLLLMFYAPARGMSEVRDRVLLAPAASLALVTQSAFTLYVQWLYLRGGFASPSLLVLVALVMQAASSLLFVGLVLTPATIFVANLFERRASLRLVLQQEYTTTASAAFYAWAAANLAALPLALLARESNLEAAFAGWFTRLLEEAAQQGNPVPNAELLLSDPGILSASFSVLFMLLLFGAWMVVAVREVFRFVWWRAIAVVLVTSLAMLVIGPLLMGTFRWLFASPFLLLVLFFVLRGYVTDFIGAQRARASFKQNLEAATLNPADASAHYNLGLIHVQRNQLNEAQQRFERSIAIDDDEVDAHFQLGRIAREQGGLADAIKHFEQVVVRDPQHRQHEVWREIGATYITAGQHGDARNALEQFLEHRRSDPEGLYLMGRALAGLGQRREAAQSMQACIEAVKTAPAYMYRTEKRWLTEAQHFLRSQQA